jgi:hypothetical protein
MNDAKPDPPSAIPPVLAPLAPLAPALMMAFWMLLGAASGIKLAQSLWQLLGWGDWAVSVAVPVGGGAGALVGALLGLITRPRLLVLLMAVFAGASAGGVAGTVAWGEIGGIGGQVGGGLVGAAAWATWLFVNRGQNRPLCAVDGQADEPFPPLF